MAEHFAIAPITSSPELFPSGTIQLSPSVSIIDTPKWVPERIKVRRPYDAYLLQSGRSMVCKHAPELPDGSDGHARAFAMLKLAALGLWISKPNPISFEMAIYSPDLEKSDESFEQWDLPFKAHVSDFTARLVESDITAARTIIERLEIIRNQASDNDDGGAIWLATTSCMKALMESWWQSRYLTFWTGIESLYGPEDAREISYRMAYRVAWFLSEDKIEAKRDFDQVRKGYNWRSKIAHGRSLKKLPIDESAEVLHVAESLLQRSLRRILLDESLLKTFDSSTRESFLDALSFS